MGATEAYRVFRTNDRAVIEKGWREAVEQADYEDGHDPYNGSINQLGRTVTRWYDNRLPDEGAAIDFIGRREKRAPAVAVSFLLPREATAAEKARVEKLRAKAEEVAKATAAVRNAALEVFKAAAVKDTAAYRPFVACTACKSKINREAHLKNRTDRLLACPVCGDRWGLATKRDATRIVKAVAKEEAARKAVEDAATPKASDKVAWVVGGLAGE